MNVSDDQFFIETLSLLQQRLTYTILVLFFITGNVGCILNTCIFFRPYLSSSSCSRYFLSASFANMFQLNFGLLSTILDYGFQIHPYHYSAFLCGFRNYSVNVAGFLSQTYLLFACIDRYAMSSNNIHYRRISTLPIAQRAIYFVTIFWLVSLSHMLIYSDIKFKENFCFYASSIYVLFISLHNLIISGFGIPVVMVIFGMLTLRNMHRIRKQARRRLRHRDYSLALMMIGNVVLNVIFTTLYTAGLISMAWLNSNSDVPTLRSAAQTRFISFVAIIFYYVPVCLSFYINILTANRFRRELKKFLLCSTRHDQHHHHSAHSKRNNERELCSKHTKYTNVPSTTCDTTG